MDLDYFRKVPPTIGCCFCTSSKTGARIIGVAQVVVGALFVFVGFFDVIHTAYYLEYGYTADLIKLWYLLIFGLVNMLLSIFILKGVNQEKLNLLKYWLFCEVGVVIFDFIMNLVIVFMTHSEKYYLGAYALEMEIVFVFSVAGILCYCILVVSSYYSLKVREETFGNEDIDRTL